MIPKKFPEYQGSKEVMREEFRLLGIDSTVQQDSRSERSESIVCCFEVRVLRSPLAAVDAG